MTFVDGSQGILVAFIGVAVGLAALLALRIRDRRRGQEE